MVANRLPVDLERAPDGSENWKRSPGGLVTALEPILRTPPGRLGGLAGPGRRRGGAVRGRRAAAAPGDPVDRGRRELLRGLLQRHALAALPRRRRPAVVPPALVAGLRAGQRAVRGAPTAEVAAEGATVWVQDYQLQLVPGMLRELRPDLRIGFFLHIPFPPVELFIQLPWREQIVRGLLGADLVGFHTPGGARNFRQLATRLAGATAAGHGEVAFRGRTVKLGAFPISIDYAGARRACRASPRSSRAPRRSATSWATRAGCCWAWTGWTTPRASTSGCAPSRSCSTRSGSRPTTRCSCRSPRPAGSGSSTTSGCAPRSSRR